MVDTWEVSTRDDPGPSRVVLADDDVLFREGLASLLERSGFDVVGQAGDGVELLSVVRSTKPHVAIIDIRMPPSHSTEGLDAARVIREELPDTAIIVLSAHVEVDEAMDLLAGGSRLGYLLKTRVTDVDEFLTTIQRIAAGASVVDPSLVHELVSARRRRDPLEVLSPRGARGARAHGRRGLQRRDRDSPLRLGGHGGEACSQHPDETRPARERDRSPTGAGRPEVPRRPR